MITLIPKENRDLRELSNWQPMTLSVRYISKVVSNVDLLLL